MRQPASLLIGLILSAATLPAMASGDIVRWVDDQGVTHFGNPQFAPANAHEPVEVKAANGMVVPTSVRSRSGSRSSGPNVVTLDRTRLENRRGFRGYASRPVRSQGRRSRR